MNLFNLYASLFLNTDEYEKKLDESKKSASSFSSKASVAFKNVAKGVTAFASVVTVAAGAVVAFGKKMIDSAGQLDDNAQQIGMSTSQYQAWAFAMEKAGTDASTLQVVMREMSTFTQQLAEGNGDALLTLQKLGIGYEDFIAQDNAGQLEMLVDALQGVEDSTEKARLAQELFGNRAYQKLMPLLNEEQGSFAELNKTLQENGQIVGDDLIQAGALLGDKIQLLTSSVKSWALAMSAELFPELSFFMDALQAMIQGADDADEGIVKAFDGLLTKTTQILLDIVGKITEALPNIAEIFVNLVQQVANSLPSIITAFSEALPSVMQSLIMLINGLISMLPQITAPLFEGIASMIMSLIKDTDWAALITTLLTSFFEIVFVQIPQFIGQLMDMVGELFSSGEGLAKIGKIGVALGAALINGLISMFESGINLAFKGVANVVNGLIKAANAIFRTNFKLFSTESGLKLPRLPVEEFAKGGILDDVTQGTVYAVAGESGAEIVAQGRHGTGVANVAQIAEAVEIGTEPTVEAIQQAAVNVVNGIISGLSMRETNTTKGQEITVKVGDKEFKGFLVDSMNEVLQAQGRQTLKKITAY